MRSTVALAWLAFGVFGCSSADTSAKGFLGNYMVSITRDNKTDPDVMSVVQGSNGSLLLTFTAGITTDPMSANAGGLRGFLQGTTLKVSAQPAHIEHSTGQLDGMLSAEGQLMPDGSSVSLTITYKPTNLGGSAELFYMLEGTKL